METSGIIDAAFVSDASVGLVGTLLAYRFGIWIQRRCGGFALLNPVLVSVVILVLALKLTHVSYANYMKGGQFVGFLLGPATVALALPLYDNLRSIHKAVHAILPAVIAGAVTTSLTAMLISRAMGASKIVVLSLAPHSATTPVAMGIADQIGGNSSLAAAFTLMTGIVGVIIVIPLMRLIRVKDMRAQGLAAGATAHGLATARMMEINETAGAYSGIAIGLSAVLTAIIAPLLLRLGVAP
ncbi:MAG: LrgB family protein [Methylocella sp.]